MIEKSLASLRDVHPFFLITFLAYKEAGLPIVVSNKELMDTSGLERNFMENYYRPAPEYDVIIDLPA